jgi:hypothetical protein
MYWRLCSNAASPLKLKMLLLKSKILLLKSQILLLEIQGRRSGSNRVALVLVRGVERCRRSTPKFVMSTCGTVAGYRDADNDERGEEEDTGIEKKYQYMRDQ